MHRFVCLVASLLTAALSFPPACLASQLYDLGAKWNANQSWCWTWPERQVHLVLRILRWKSLGKNVVKSELGSLYSASAEVYILLLAKTCSKGKQHTPISV